MRNNDYLVSRIITGYIPCYIYNPTVDNYQSLVIGKLDLVDSIFLSELYDEAIREGEIFGLLSSDELMSHLLRLELWSLDEEAELEESIQKLEDSKLELFRVHLNKSLTAQQHRLEIRNLKKKIRLLENKKTQFDHMTIKGYAVKKRMRHSLARRLRTVEGTKIIKSYDELSFFPINEVLSAYVEAQLSEEEYRELARSNEWKAIWTLDKERIFNLPAIEWTDEQKTMVMWSRLYDNIVESPEYPGDYMLKDDDLLDGWLIDQNRKREDELKTRQSESFLATNNAKIKDSQELFIMAETVEDAGRIDSMNNAQARIYKNQKLSSIPEGGSIDEGDMPFIRKQIQMDALKASMENRTGK